MQTKMMKKLRDAIMLSLLAVTVGLFEATLIYVFIRLISH